jgi:regulatory protein
MESGQTYVIDAGLIIEHGLAAGVHIDVDSMTQLLNADDLIAAKAGAARQLAYRPRSVAEIRSALSQRGFRPVTIDAVVERFTELGYLDDAEFANRWISNREALAPRGKRLLRQELRQKGVQSDLVEESIEQADLDEFESALRIATNRFEKMAGVERDTQRRRIAGYLERRGFGYDAVRSVDRALFGHASNSRTGDIEELEPES